MTFNLAHWLFAYSYLAMSCQIELFRKDMPPDHYSFQIKILNFLVCLYNVIVPATVWIYEAYDKRKAAEIAYDIS